MNVSAEPNTITVTNRDNTFQRFDVLRHNRKKRSKHAQFIVEGVKCLSALVDCGWDIEMLAFASDQELSHWARDFIRSPQVKTLVEMPSHLLHELSEKEDKSELIAIATIPSDDFSRLSFSSDALFVALDRPSSPGNLGSSIRSCSCFGVDGVVITGHAADVYHPQAVRGSMGALFSLPIVRAPSHSSVVKLKNTASHHGVKITTIGTSAKATQSLYDTDLSRPLTVVFGNETSGMSAEYEELCDELVSIPISGVVSSLNVSCALSVVLSEIRRQRDKQ